MGTYHSSGAVVALSEDIDRAEPQLPEHVVVALHELAGACKEGLLALAVGTGMQVMRHSSRRTSSRSQGRRASTTRSAPRCDTAARPAV